MLDTICMISKEIPVTKIYGRYVYYEYYANGSYCFIIVDKDTEHHFESLLECLAWAASHYESDDNIDRPLNIADELEGD